MEGRESPVELNCCALLLGDHSFFHNMDANLFTIAEFSAKGVPVS